jgi:hypothetical protein
MPVGTAHHDQRSVPDITLHLPEHKFSVYEQGRYHAAQIGQLQAFLARDEVTYR